MTEILDLRPDSDGTPTIVRAIRFFPWPFDDQLVGISTEQFIDGEGDLLDPIESGYEASCLSEGDNDVLVVMSDGSFAVSSVQGVRAYGKPSPP